MVASAIIGAASLFGGLMSSRAGRSQAKAADRSAELQAEAAREAIREHGRQYDVSRADLGPYRATGGAALHTLSDLFIPGGQSVVQMQGRLSELRARRAMLAGGAQAQAPAPAPVVQNQLRPRIFGRTGGDQGDGGGGGMGGGGGGMGGGACCFVAGTLVVMESGAWKKIEDIEIGEKVQGNGTINAVVGFNRPLLEQRPLISLNDSGHPFTTWDHPFWDDEKTVWRCVSPEHRKNTAGLTILPLVVGSKIATVRGDVEITAVTQIETYPETQLYDLKLDGDHTYVADGYIVHNC